ncbi:FAD-dependent oxidoreductase [Actinoplanes sp. CA-015351]|uniref:flavin monoamine oxidase family protein n=1 Tax=Actinoplanes sp. CA-015351 TaxID=3239897 RepID=UPI003D952FD9
MGTGGRLVAAAVSRWGDDPWALGSWSLIGRGGTPGDRVALGEPVGGRLRIAGEATHPTRAGMTHGAFEQGIAAGIWAAEAGHRRVAVVGAGMAGLGAARELGRLGVAVEIWEARDRVGGRTAGVDVGGFGFDLGANWLQQYDDNVLARLAEELGLTVTPTDFTDPFVLGPARSGVPKGLESELRARLEAAAPQAAVGDVVGEWLREPGRFEAGAIRDFVDAEIVMDSGAPLSWLSARYGFEPGVGEGDRWIVGGYRLLVEHLAAGVDVRLNRPVTEIRVGERGVTLIGDGHAADFDAVIVTVPLAVLTTIGFAPALPDRHRVAVERLGMGRVEKVVLRFEQRFWPEHAAGYYRVHGPGENEICEWLDASAADGVPTVVGLFAGPWLGELWDGTDAEVAERAAGIFRDAVRG